MRIKTGDIVIGIDHDPLTVKKHQETGRNVVLGDPADKDFWIRATEGRHEQIKLVLLTLPNHAATMAAAQAIVGIRDDVLIAATAQFDDEIAELRELGVQAVHNFYAGAGAGLAEQVFEKFKAIKTTYGNDALAGYASAKATNEDNYIFQKWVRAVMKTNNVDHCARL